MDCCGTEKREENQGFELVRIERARNACTLCEEYAQRQQTKPVAVLCCEGACLRGEIARQAANLLCFSLQPDKTARICLGGAFTKDGGQRDLVRLAPRVLVLEGCFVNCASRMMQGVLAGLQPEVIVTDRLIDFDRKRFAVVEMAPEEIAAHARSVATQVASRL